MSPFLPRLAFALTLLSLFIPAATKAQEEKPEDANKKEAEKRAMQLLLLKADEEYRVFFRRPEKVPEYWAAIKFEVGVGKFDLAALHLKMLLQKEPAADVDKELVQIENAEGLASFIRLQNIRKWSDEPAFQQEADKNVKVLIDRVTAGLEKYLGDPARIKKFIKNLDAPTVEERAFALTELQRAKERAAPHLVETLMTSAGTPLHARVVEAMYRLDPEIMPPLLETLKAANAKDAKDLDLRLTVLDIVKKRAEKRAVPYLWHLSSAPMYPAQVQTRAKAVLAYLLETEPTHLPSAKIALTDLAERYYRHKVAFTAGRPVRVWPWDGQQLAVTPVSLTPTQAEEFFGLRYSREALDLDPKYQPAQKVFLSLMLERTLGPNLDQILLKPMPPKLQELLVTIDPELLVQVLDRALDEGNAPVAIATVQALGERGAVGLGQKALTRALNYADRRVQLAAVKATLRLPSTGTPVAAARIVDILKRFIISDGNPKALVAFVLPEKAAEIRQIIKDIGFDPMLVNTAKDIFDRLKKTSDFDAILLGSGLPYQEFTFLLANLRADSDQGKLPILVFAPKDKLGAWTQAAQRYRNVKIYPDLMLTAPGDLKSTVENQIKVMTGMRVTLAERKEMARVSLDILWRMARGEYSGYDLRPAQDAIVEALANPDMTLLALEILGRLPGQVAQSRLTSVVLNLAQDKLRLPAAIELNRHIQKYGLMLDNGQKTALKEAYQNAADEPQLHTQLAMVIGSMNSTPRLTGTRLFDFRPDQPAPPPPPAQPKEKKD